MMARQNISKKKKPRKKKVPTKKGNVVFQPAITHNKSRTAILEANSSQS